MNAGLQGSRRVYVPAPRFKAKKADVTRAIDRAKADVTTSRAFRGIDWTVTGDPALSELPRALPPPARSLRATLAAVAWTGEPAPPPTAEQDQRSLRSVFGAFRFE